MYAELMLYLCLPVQWCEAWCAHPSWLRYCSMEICFIIIIIVIIIVTVPILGDSPGPHGDHQVHEMGQSTYVVLTFSGFALTSLYSATFI